MQARAMVFAMAKAGNAEDEWEDGAAGVPAGGNPRFIVADGATEAYDAIRWVDHLVSTFTDPDTAPELNCSSFRTWFAHAQQHWIEYAPARVNYIEERKFAQGSFATLVCCELVDLGGPRPRWRAAALGDAVLFHVRGGRRIAHFPPLTPEEFGTTPDGAHTSPERIDAMLERLTFHAGPLAAGDLLFLATDALAQWMLRHDHEDPFRVWDVLARVDHPVLFERLVDDQRGAGRMVNDDVTLVRVHLDVGPPACLVSCLS